MRLEQKVAVITGAGSGFGQAAAVRFAEEGAEVVVVDLDEAGGERTLDLVAEVGPRGELVVADVATTAGAAAAVGTATNRFGRVDVLVNNAGIAYESPADTWDSEEQIWDRILQVNLKSVYLCTRAAVPGMIENGGGSIINTASIAASCRVGGSAYAASKGGMISYTRHISRDLAPHNVRVNCVSPGFMRTPMSTGERTGMPEEDREARMAAMADRVPMQRTGAAVDIANAMLYLASAESGYVTGREIVVDGGYLVR